MNLDKDYAVEGQMSIFDCFSPDLWSGRMFPEHLVPTVEKISEPSSKKRQGSSVKMPLFLDLRTENGHQVAASWETGGVLLGVYTMRSFGEYPSEEKESRLSQILEANPHQKYSLSARACQGILRRAQKRGKVLPELLEKTLVKQSAFKNEPDVRGGARESLSSMSEQEPCQPSTINPSCKAAEVYGISAFESNSMKSANPNSGIYRADTSRTLDLNGGNPACNQGGMMVVQGANMYNQTLTGGVSMSVTGAATDPHHIPCVVLEGNGSRPSHMGDGYRESDTMYTLNATEQHAVCWDGGQISPTLTANNAGGAQRMPDKDNFNAVVTYGLDRASFNQGQNAQYDFSVIEEQAQTLISRGPGGVLTEQ